MIFFLLSRKGLHLAVLQALGVGHGPALCVLAQVLQRLALQHLKELQARRLFHGLEWHLEGRQGNLVLDDVVGQHKGAHGHIAVATVRQNDLVKVGGDTNVGWVANDLVLDIVLLVDRVLVRQVQGAGDHIDVLVLVRELAAEILKVCPV